MTFRLTNVHSRIIRLQRNRLYWKLTSKIAVKYLGLLKLSQIFTEFCKAIVIFRLKFIYTGCLLLMLYHVIFCALQCLHLKGMESLNEAWKLKR